MMKEAAADASCESDISVNGVDIAGLSKLGMAGCSLGKDDCGGAGGGGCGSGGISNGCVVIVRVGPKVGVSTEAQRLRPK